MQMQILRTMRVFALALPLAGCGGGALAEFQAVSRESRAAEARPVLKQAWTLQEAYRERNGRYATTFAELEEVGWEAPAGLRYFRQPRIVRAQGEALCMEMEPVRAELWPQHVDQGGQVLPGPCP